MKFTLGGNKSDYAIQTAKQQGEFRVISRLTTNMKGPTFN